MFSKCLATGENLKRRHVLRDSICRRCGLEEETEKHIFFDCIYAKGIWRASRISNAVINSSSASLEDKMKEILMICSSARFSYFLDLPIWILWRLWKSRNILVFQQKQIAWRLIIKYAKQDAEEWKKVEEVQQNYDSGTTGVSNNSKKQMWRAPPAGWLKCNVDGAFMNQDTFSSAGWVVRDELGTYQGSVQAVGNKVQSALESEMQSILMAIQHCWMLGYRRIIIEGDSKKAMDILNNKLLHFELYNWKREILWWKQKFEAMEFCWIQRDGNKVADVLAK